MHNFLKSHNIYHEAYSPFGEGFNNIFKDQTISEIADKYNKTPAQIMLKYLIMKDIIAIPKSSNTNRMQENINIFDFKLSEEDLYKIEKLDIRKSCSDWPASMNKEKEY